MATVCGTSLALMDAGVPLKEPVAGIAMGLIKEGDDFSVLSDIFVSHHGPTMNLIRDFTDFHMLKLLPVSGVMVLGFAKAYQLEGPMLDVAAHLRES